MFFKKLHIKFTANRPYYSIFLNDSVSEAIQISGLSEYEVIIPLFDLLSKKFIFHTKTAIDVGANIGNHTVFFSGFFNEVVAFEPNPLTFKLLEVNTNNYKNVRLFNRGLSNTNQKMKLSVPKGNIGGSSMLDDSDSTATHLVDIISLDCLVEIDFSNIGLIKVDVEGMELEVLLGAISIIRSSLPIILFEQFSSSIINGYSKVQLLLIQEGYCFFVLKESHFSESKWLRRIKRIGLFIMNGTLKYDLIKISNLESKYYPLIVAIHESYL